MSVAGARVIDEQRTFDLIVGQMSDPEAQWSLGTFGAIAEFMRDADEPAEVVRGDTSITAATRRGGIRLEMQEGLRPIAFETTTKEAWSQRIAFCLTEQQCAMNRRGVLTELGPDAHAVRPEDKGAVLFDLGLSALQVDACIRTADAKLIDTLRGSAGRSLFEPGNGAMGAIVMAGPHRVFITRCGRAEVYQPIPMPGGKSPEGPHTHVLPKLLASKRTHAATEPIPAGWVSCAHLYPAHPLRDGYGRNLPFDADRHAAFQTLLGEFGDKGRVVLKRRVFDAVAAGEGPAAVPAQSDRYGLATVRVALRQVRVSTGRVAPSDWLAAYENARAAAEDEEPEELIH